MCTQIPFTTYAENVPQTLAALDAGARLKQQKRIFIKPNLVNAAPPPVTTPVECCAALIDTLRHYTDAPITIAEGTGTAKQETPAVFETLGYTDLARDKAVDLLDLNTAQLVELRNPDCQIFPHMYLPQALMHDFLVSVPVLKAHSLAQMTGSLKNMMGLAPPQYYGQKGGWKKARFHTRMHSAIVALNRYRSADLTLMDASRGLATYHLGGPECDPPLQTLLAGWDPLEVDRAGATLLGLNWKDIPHLTQPIVPFRAER